MSSNDSIANALAELDDPSGGGAVFTDPGAGGAGSNVTDFSDILGDAGESRPLPDLLRGGDAVHADDGAGGDGGEVDNGQGQHSVPTAVHAQMRRELKGELAHERSRTALLEQQLAALTGQVHQMQQGPQNQAQQQPEQQFQPAQLPPMPDAATEPEAFGYWMDAVLTTRLGEIVSLSQASMGQMQDVVQQQLDGMTHNLRTQFLKFTHDQAVKMYGPDVVKDATAAVRQAGLGEVALQQSDPTTWAIDWYRGQLAQQHFGTNPDVYDRQLFEQFVTNPDLRQRVVAGIQQQAGSQHVQQAGQASQQSQQQQTFPPSGARQQRATGAMPAQVQSTNDFMATFLGQNGAAA